MTTKEVCRDCGGVRPYGSEPGDSVCYIGPFVTRETYDTLQNAPDTGDMNQEIEEYQAAEGRKFYGSEPTESVYQIPVATPASDSANPKQRYGDLKVPLQLVPPALTLAAATALGEGARKYGPYNWRTSKVEALTYVGAMLRHLAAWQDGEDVDPESAEGKTHLAGVAASLAILLDAIEGGFVIDNRPQPGPAPRLVRTPGAKS